jgi:hypothetical protein
MEELLSQGVAGEELYQKRIFTYSALLLFDCKSVSLYYGM